MSPTPNYHSIYNRTDPEHRSEDGPRYDRHHPPNSTRRPSSQRQPRSMADGVTTSAGGNHYPISIATLAHYHQSAPQSSPSTDHQIPAHLGPRHGSRCIKGEPPIALCNPPIPHCSSSTDRRKSLNTASAGSSSYCSFYRCIPSTATAVLMLLVVLMAQLSHHLAYGMDNTDYCRSYVDDSSGDVVYTPTDTACAVFTKCCYHTCSGLSARRIKCLQTDSPAIINESMCICNAATRLPTMNSAFLTLCLAISVLLTTRITTSW